MCSLVFLTYPSTHTVATSSTKMCLIRCCELPCILRVGENGSCDGKLTTARTPGKLAPTAVHTTTSVSSCESCPSWYCGPSLQDRNNADYGSVQLKYLENLPFFLVFHNDGISQITVDQQKYSTIPSSVHKSSLIFTQSSFIQSSYPRVPV